ncbi:MAG TPA: SGNH/GDSL hydrolase family protein [Gemmataceae bacterium]|nr:SGNH/GDSL hydrolase family protein [Gemmataceae bacterium]
MFHAIRPALAALLAVAGAAAAPDAPPMPLVKGDRIAFLGDSITEQGAKDKGYVTLIKNAVQDKYKDLGVEIIPAGVSGNKVPDIQARLDRDVLSKKPTIVVIYIGINDVWHGEKDPAKGTPKDKYEAGLRDVIQRCQAAGARVILCTPSVIGEKNDGSNTNDPKLDEYSDISRAVAKDLKVPTCDLRKAFQDYEKAHNTDNKESGVLTADRVHLNDAGNKFVAEQILKMFGD